jgi:osmotically-inducible protein OsmY
MNNKPGLSVKVALVVMMSASVPIVAQAAIPGHGERIRRSDAAIKIDVERTLRADRALMDSRIVVKSVRKGVVLLSGYAASSSDDVRARRLTARRRGVRGVFSESVIGMRAGSPALIAIQPRSPMQHGAFDSEDDVIRRNVQSALNDLDARANADVHVRVEEGVVWLTGSVPTWQGNNERLYAARSVTGVRSVVNELRVAAPSDERR